jgi:predicted dehydrogenase
MASKEVSRRQAMQYTAAGVAAPYFIPSGVLASEGKPGANDRIIIGFIGAGGRARQLMSQMPEGGKIVCVADCDLGRAQTAAKQDGRNWKVYHDYHKMLEKENIDAVVIATPDHARARIAIFACIAGKDVYAEKPLTAYISEGRALVNAARKHQRVFQVGSQQRTMEYNRVACAFVRDGGLGKIKKVIGHHYLGPEKYTGLPAETIPNGDNWNEWVGPTPMRPFNNQLQHQWMRWWDYSGGDVTNWGAHGIDQIQWALGMSHSGPTEIWPVTPGPSGKFAMRYANGIEASFEVAGVQGGGIFIGENGKVEINRNKYTTNPKDLIKNGPSPELAAMWEGDGWIARPHVQNWLDCIRTREKPNADVEIGHRSISVCHLCNIARELGRKIHWNPETERFVDDPEADKYLTRPRREGYELPEA